MTDAMGGNVAMGGPKVWFTAAELADLRLPGLSSNKRKINERAMAERWALRTDAAGMPLARPRAARGGGIEYHVGVLPPSASTELVKTGVSAVIASVPANDAALAGAGTSGGGQLWSWFDQQSDAIKAEAARRLTVLDAIEALVGSGLTVTAAIAAVGAQHDAAPSTIAEWRKAVLGAERSDWLPRLAPQRKGGGKEAEVDAGAWTVFLSDYLRPEAPTLASCYRRTLDGYCAKNGVTLPHMKTLQRKLERDVDHRVVVARRQGADALRATMPSQQRSIAQLHALELVNIDGHKWDVFVKWPDGRIARPMMVAIQDVYSRKFVAWRIGETESAVLTRLAFADLFRDWGIPKACLMDNGRAFASKWITGGAVSRFRFKIRPEEPTGLLTSLGVRVHWALPFRGSSKPIERAFRDLCDAVAKHPAFAGAYTGNKPDAKPENYGSTAVDLETFKRVVTLGIAAHNAQLGRRTEACAGRDSFDQAFEASYVKAPIGKASPEQLRMALLAADRVSTDRKSGAISLYGNQYWSEAMSRLAGQRVVVRFDPDNLHSEVHVYGLDGAYLTSAALQARTGFLDAQAAGVRARQEAALKKATKAKAAALQLLTAAQLADMMPDLPEGEDETPEPTVIRPVRVRGNALLKTAPAVAVAPEPTPETEDITDRWARAAERMSPQLRVVE